MDSDHIIRLEILKIIHRKDMTPEQNIEQAQKFEKYVVGADRKQLNPVPLAGTPKKDRVR